MKHFDSFHMQTNTGYLDDWRICATLAATYLEVQFVPLPGWSWTQKGKKLVSIWLWTWTCWGKHTIHWFWTSFSLLKWPFVGIAHFQTNRPIFTHQEAQEWLTLQKLRMNALKSECVYIYIILLYYIILYHIILYYIILYICVLYAIVDAYLLCNLNTQILHTRHSLLNNNIFATLQRSPRKEFHGIFGPQGGSDNFQVESLVKIPWGFRNALSRQKTTFNGG